ncbi:plasmid stabilization protein [Streptomyces sp. NPDC020731]|uniref:plasmid stabilization protein n=1 Tax=Streptomyces sp. NPDC020731 TaxID=3365085 RepID=UPI0037ACD219
MPAGSGPQWMRQYEHIKDGAEDRGASKGRAKEIAARTVNKERAQSGEAKSASRSSTKGKSPSQRGGEKSGSSRGGGSGGGTTGKQLYQEAKKKGVESRSTMNKDQPAKALGRN